MRRDPLRRVPTRVRLWIASAWCAAPLGLAWPAGSGHSVPVSQAPVRVFLALAIAVFAFCALRPRTAAALAAARVGCAALVVALALAAGHGAAPVVLCLAVAVVLTAPLVATRAPSAGVLA
jgi:hypothetical protein